MSWFVYCLATVEEPSSAMALDGSLVKCQKHSTAKPIQTYIGATVDVDRRLAQHNRQLGGGAKATGVRGGEWYRVCYVRGFLDNHQALSFEWHWKYFSKKRGGGEKPLERRQKGLDACLEWFRAKHEGVLLEVIYE